MERNEWVVRRMRRTDRDLARIVEQINSAGMEMDAIWLGADEGNDAAHAMYCSLVAQAIEPGVIYTCEIDQVR